MEILWIGTAFAEEQKSRIQRGMGQWEEIGWELSHRAEKGLTLGPWSITDTPGLALSGNVHDYYSEAPYWWPNPEDPDGPFIRKDGQVRPERFDGHRTAMAEMCDTVLLLAEAGYYLDNREYLDRAALLLHTWFAAPETKMNPHLEYAQAIHGICSGRGIGIIDTKELIKAVFAASMLSQYEQYGALINQLQEWFSAYSRWMNTSKNGLEEKNYFNNHANWWNTQQASYAAFIEDQALLSECFERFCSVIVPGQLSPDGSFTDELTRTNSFHYCLFNLEASAILCELAHQKGKNLWHFETPEGKGIKKAIDFMLPYIKNPFLWQYEQIKGGNKFDQYALQLGALRLGCEAYGQANRENRKDTYLIRQGSALGPLCLHPGF